MPRRFAPGVTVRLQVALWIALLLSLPSRASAQAVSADAALGPAVGFSNLVVRIDGHDEIGIASQDHRVVILEALRKAGFHAVGAENLVFGKDRANLADYVLGGTIRELECKKGQATLSCRIGIEWQLLDVRRDAVVYTTVARAAELNVDKDHLEGLGRSLVLDALRFLTLRPRFRGMVAKDARPDPLPAPKYPNVSLRRCPTPPKEMPAGTEQALRATVLVQVNDGFGSGFFITPDGLALTAAHVVNTRDLSVRLRDGTVMKAQVVRRAPAVDAAIVRVTPPNDLPMPCLPLDLDAKAAGAEIYAVGSPASDRLAFSLTRGIVSGVRDFDGNKFLQTDASISPGNSGGPLIDKQGRAVGIVSWKVASRNVEGVAFGVPVEEALRGLGLTVGTDTDAVLLRGKPYEADSSATAKPFVDIEDPVPSIDPRPEDTSAADKAREDRLAAEKRAILGERRLGADGVGSSTRNDAAYLALVRWMSAGVVGVSAIGVTYSYLHYNRATTTRSEFETLRTINDVSWVAGAAGAAVFGLTFIWPTASPPPAMTTSACPTVAVGPRRISIAVEF